MDTEGSQAGRPRAADEDLDAYHDRPRWPSRVVLLSHVHFGADRRPAGVPGLRALLVQFPGREVRPPLADLCERWASVGAAELGVLHQHLGHLLTHLL